MNKTEIATAYKQLFTASDLSYADVAHALGTCELTARRKINGETKIKAPERAVLDALFNKEITDDEEVTDSCTISRSSR